MSFGLVRNDEIRSKARSIIRQLFDELPVQALRARRSAMHFVGTPGRLDGVKLEVVVELGGNTDADRLYLGFLPGHRSGSIRGEALRILGTDPSDFIIPFAIIRLVDWVREVRREAEVAVRKDLDTK